MKKEKETKKRKKSWLDRFVIYFNGLNENIRGFLYATFLLAFSGGVFAWLPIISDCPELIKPYYLWTGILIFIIFEIILMNHFYYLNKEDKSFWSFVGHNILIMILTPVLIGGWMGLVWILGAITWEILRAFLIVGGGIGIILAIKYGLYKLVDK